MPPLPPALLVILAIMLLTLLTGCANEANFDQTSLEICLTLTKIFASAADTDETLRQVLEHNIKVDGLREIYACD